MFSGDIGPAPLMTAAPTAPTGREIFPGLTSQPREEWPRVAVEPYQRPIDMLRPGSDLHRRILDYLLRRLQDSERAMTKFHYRWSTNEKRHQAWLDLSDYEKIVKEMNNSGKPPKAVNITIPYQWATLSTMTTYMLQVFAGRRPYLNVGSYGPWLENALKMEVVLQYQNDHNSIVGTWWQWFNDMFLYGVGVVFNRWRVQTAMRTRISEKPVFDVRSGKLQMEGLREQQEIVEYEGNIIQNVDPYMFYPDPRTPMSDVSTKGEYVFIRSFEGKHGLKRLEQQGLLKWVDQAPSSIAHTTRGQTLSARSLLSGGDPHPGGPFDWQLVSGQGYYKNDLCSIDIIPRELGLGHSDKVEKWLFTILNDAQIVQAEKQVDDHGEHPVVATEPTSMGYSFGAAGPADYIAPLQDSMSWFLNSHMENVRGAINNSFLFDPEALEEDDIRRPGPSKYIRLKRAALGRDIRTVFQQIPVVDVTANHVKDMQVYFDIGQRISAVSENLLGLQDAGGRKTATEVRTSSEGAASRLAALARVISAKGITRLTRQQSLNTQQWMSSEFYTRVVGPDGMMKPLTITPDAIVGDFYFPVHDGTLPLDRIATLDIWKELLLGVMQDPLLRQTYSVPKIFEFVAELGGAKNIRSFRLSPMDPDMIAQQAQQGNMAPLPVRGGPSGLVNAALPQPRQRMNDFRM